ncbi:L-2,4-diaminobutyrate decarboxylase [compost metagenome]|uniref:pyridoxal-dependent decarboxylase n=1 Tax=Aneurinibacillus migulanus TaxID=47500 RepID=UPI000F90C3D7|nr:pyridoxal-dependent decarboxylase [Aneurinibacillus migulanus]MED4730813.1 pyridoxal-dependent decarboxylase [Aneurinibacillus migulanus]
MPKKIEEDLQDIKNILDKVVNEAMLFFDELDSRPAAVNPKEYMHEGLPTEGWGTMKVMEQFQSTYSKSLSGSAGPRYLGFVTGGATPASIAGDWLVSVYDQNVTSIEDSVAGLVEVETIRMLRELFHLPKEFSGAFVSGATMANFVGLAQARQWAAHQHGIDISQHGLYNLPNIKVVSGSPHSSIYKSLSMLGMGRQSVHLIPCLPNREAVDIEKLREFLEENKDMPCVIVANAGTVNTVDFDDLYAIGELKKEYSFWLHVDAAFGGFAACSTKYSHLVNSMDKADSITIDAHKWLNVPYDSAMQFTRHKSLQVEVFQNNAAYLGNAIDHPEFVHLTPENSRRFRALPAWFALKAYGYLGYQEIVEGNVEMAQLLTEKIQRSNKFELLAPTRLNVVCFTPVMKKRVITFDDIKHFLDVLKQDGYVFMTPTIYQGIPGIRAAFSNWRTKAEDVELIWNSLCRVCDSI